jgi:hypothetical protein
MKYFWAIFDVFLARGGMRLEFLSGMGGLIKQSVTRNRKDERRIGTDNGKSNRGFPSGMTTNEGNCIPQGLKPG